MTRLLDLTVWVGLSAGRTRMALDSSVRCAEKRYGTNLRLRNRNEYTLKPSPRNIYQTVRSLHRAPVCLKMEPQSIPFGICNDASLGPHGLGWSVCWPNADSFFAGSETTTLQSMETQPFDWMTGWSRPSEAEFFPLWLETHRSSTDSLPYPYQFSTNRVFELAVHIINTELLVSNK